MAHDMWHVTRETWHATCDMWHVDGQLPPEWVAPCHGLQPTARPWQKENTTYIWNYKTFIFFPFFSVNLSSLFSVLTCNQPYGSKNPATCTALSLTLAWNLLLCADTTYKRSARLASTFTKGLQDLSKLKHKRCNIALKYTERVRNVFLNWHTRLARFNRFGLTRAVLETPLSIINWLINSSFLSKFSCHLHSINLVI